MAKNISTTIFSNYTLAAGATGYADIFLEDIDNVQFLLDMAYTGGTSSWTGVEVRLFNGFGPLQTNDAVVNFDAPVKHSIGSTHADSLASPYFGVPDNYELVTMPTFLASQGGPYTVRVSFFLNELSNRWSKWVSFQIVNKDQSKPVVLKLRADL